MQKFSAEHLQEVGTSLFERMGVPRADAALVTDVHVDSDLRGDESHGFRLLLMHLERIKAGTIRPKAKITLLRDHGAVAHFDAHHSLGQVVAARAMELAIEKARRFGIGAVSIRTASSFTSTKYYPLMAARAGMIGLAYSNSRAMMPPEGAITRKVGASRRHRRGRTAAVTGTAAHRLVTPQRSWHPTVPRTPDLGGLPLAKAEGCPVSLSPGRA